MNNKDKKFMIDKIKKSYKYIEYSIDIMEILEAIVSDLCISGTFKEYVKGREQYFVHPFLPDINSVLFDLNNAKSKIQKMLDLYSLEDSFFPEIFQKDLSLKKIYYSDEDPNNKNI